MGRKIKLSMSTYYDCGLIGKRKNNGSIYQRAILAIALDDDERLRALDIKRYSYNMYLTIIARVNAPKCFKLICHNSITITEIFIDEIILGRSYEVFEYLDANFILSNNILDKIYQFALDTNDKRFLCHFESRHIRYVERYKRKESLGAYRRSDGALIKARELSKLWDMNTGYTQWLSREIMEDVVSLIVEDDLFEKLY